MGKSFLSWYGRSLVILLLFSVTVTCIHVSAASTQPNVYIDPPYKEVLVNKTFSISVSITNVTDLYRWDFNLWYTTACIDVISVTEEPFLKAYGAKTSFTIFKIRDAYNATHGLITVRCKITAGSGVSGSGLLATISFNATSLGSSDLTFNYSGYPYPVKLSDSKLADMACTATGGTVEVKTSISPYGPTASFTVSPRTLYTGKSITFDASVSKTGCNGTHLIPITLYSWNFGDGSTSNGTNPIANHTYASIGKYNVTLTVYAPGATPETDTMTHQITITSPAIVFTVVEYPPLGEAAINQNVTVSVNIANVTNLYGYEFQLYYNTTILNATSINIPLDHFLNPVEPAHFYNPYQEINDELGFVWVAMSLLDPELPKNGGGTLVKIKFKATALGSSNLTLYYPDYPYPVLLTSRYAEIPCNTTSGTVNVVPVSAPQGPKAYFELIPPPNPIDPGIPTYVNEEITFDASASEGGWNGTHPIPITLYSWTFGDGSTSNGTNPILNHTYASVGKYNVTLTVYAPGATPETDTMTHQITITIRPVEPPDFPPEDIWIIIGIIISFPTILFLYSKWPKIWSKIWPKRRKTEEET